MPATVELTRFWPESSLGVAREVATRVRAAGGRLWLVGGAVRDALRGESGADLDAEVFGLTQARLEPILRDSGRFHFVGKAFPVWRSNADDLDLALPRRERATGPRHQDFAIEVDPAMPLEEAAARRDFTVNAILYDPLDGTLADPFGGAADLAAARLRHTSPQFAEDALRVLRAMQFAARFDFTVAPATVALCRSLDATHLPAERIWGEWEKLLLKGRRVSRGLQFLRDCGWLADTPELAALVDCPQDLRWHPEGDVWTHTLLSLDAFARERLGEREEDLVVGLAVLCHDLGKASHTVFRDGRWRSPDHEAAGLAPAERLLRRFTREHRLLEPVLHLVGTHMRPYQLFTAGAGDSAVRRLARQVGRLDRLVRVARADARGRAGSSHDPFPAGEWLLTRAAAMAVSSAQPKPLLHGRHLLALGMTPGPAVGALLERLFDAQLEGHFNDRPGGLALARRWLHQTPDPPP
jgi:tRNA nucleotidyltransferase (CCA-adding enzyme)